MYTATSMCSSSPSCSSSSAEGACTCWAGEGPACCDPEVLNQRTHPRTRAARATTKESLCMVGVKKNAPLGGAVGDTGFAHPHRRPPYLNRDAGFRKSHHSKSMRFVALAARSCVATNILSDDE